MAFDVEGARKAGYSDTDIAEFLASQSKFDAGAARQAGYGDADIIAHLLKPAAVDNAEKQYFPPETGKRVGTPNSVTPKTENFDFNNTPMGRGMRDAGQGFAQFLARGAEALAPAGSSLESAIRENRQGIESHIGQEQAEYKSKIGLRDDPVGRAVGGIAMTAPTALISGGATLPGQILASAAQGTIAGLAQPVDPIKTPNYWAEKAKQGALGAATGAGTTAVIGGAARALAPNVSPEVRMLRDEGVQLTPGQTLGGGWKTAEDKLTSVPLLGDMIRNAQRRSVESYNTAAINRALRPAGLELADDIRPGREAIEAAGTALSQAYDDVLGNITARVDRPFQQEMGDIAAQARMRLTPDLQQNFQSTLGNLFGTQRMQGNQMTGQEAKEVVSALGQLSAQFRRSQDPFQRNLGQLYADVRSAFNGVLERSAPDLAPQLRGIDNAYANMVRMELAAGSTAAKEGVFTPARLNMAVRQADNSVRHRQFAQGNARMQDFADAGENVIGRTYPDSGTAGRALLGLAAMGGAGAINPYAAAGMAATLPAYTAPGSRALNALIAGERPVPVLELGQNLGMVAPFGGLFGPAVIRP